MDKEKSKLIAIPVFIMYIVLATAAGISIGNKPLPWGKKWAWLLLLLVQPIGPIIYFVVGSKKLDVKADEYMGYYRF